MFFNAKISQQGYYTRNFRIYTDLFFYNDQQMHNYFTNYHTATCFDTIVSSSGSL